MRLWFAATWPLPWLILAAGSLVAIIVAPAFPLPFPTLFGSWETVAVPTILAVLPAAAWSRVRQRRDLDDVIGAVRRTSLLDLGLAVAPVAIATIAAPLSPGASAALVPLMAFGGLSLVAAIRRAGAAAAILPTGWTLASLLCGKFEGVVAPWALPLVDIPTPVTLVVGVLILCVGATAFLVDSR